MEISLELNADSEDPDSFILMQLHGESREVAFINSFGSWPEERCTSLAAHVHSEMKLFKNTKFSQENGFVLAMIATKYRHVLDTLDLNCLGKIILGTATIFYRDATLQGSISCATSRNSGKINSTQFQTCHIGEFVISPRHRRKGYGDIMFNLLKDYMAKQRIPLMTFSSCIGSQFYTDRGCVPVYNLQFRLEVTQKIVCSQIQPGPYSKERLSQVSEIIESYLGSYQYRTFSVQDLHVLYEEFIEPSILVRPKAAFDTKRNESLLHGPRFSLVPDFKNLLYHFSRRDYGINAAFDKERVPQIAGLVIDLPWQKPFWILWKYETFQENRIHILALSHDLVISHEKLTVLVLKMLGKIAKELLLSSVDIWLPLHCALEPIGTRIMARANYGKILGEDGYVPFIYAPINSPLADFNLQWVNMSLLDHL